MYSPETHDAYTTDEHVYKGEIKYSNIHLLSI